MPSKTRQHKSETQKPAKNSKRVGKRHVFAIASMMMIAMATFLAGFAIIGYSFLRYQYIDAGPTSAERIFENPDGARLSRIAKKLDDEGIISSAWIFKFFVKFDGGETELKAGEFAIPPQSSMWDVYEILKDGKAILYPLTIPEGLTSAQIVRLVENAENLSGTVNEVPAEGTLLPETYLLPKSATKSDLLKQMQDAQRKLFEGLWDTRAANLPIQTRKEALILASVVEKETGHTNERGRVAGVFINRLNKGIRLESDSTIIYGLTKGESLGRGLRRSEIDRKTDWNTYQIDGLPKTPICNPGRTAIEAVLNPDITGDLFFVADGSGGHVFAQTLREHNKNVANWRKIEQARKHTVR